MLIDFMPVSLNDYPGEIAATAFTAGCNMRCPYCHNATLIEFSDQDISEDFFSYLSERKHLIKAVCITGGEPTLHPTLPNLIQQLKDRGLKVKLDTNGTNPDMLQKLLYANLLDYVAMDIKTVWQDYADFHASPQTIKKIRESAEILRTSDIEYEFRITVLPRLLSLAQAEEIAREISPCKRLVLQGYRYSEGVLDPIFCGTDPCPPEYLKQLADIISPYCPVKIRN